MAGRSTTFDNYSFVIARTSSFTYKGNAAKAQEVSRE
jgi:TolB-like protein